MPLNFEKPLPTPPRAPIPSALSPMPANSGKRDLTLLTIEPSSTEMEPLLIEVPTVEPKF